MKKLSVLVVALFYGMISLGQIEKGYWLVGGSGSLSNYKQEYINSMQNVTGKYTEVNILSTLGYFLKDKIAIGVRPGFYLLRSRGVSSSGSQTQSSIFSIGPFTRYYFLDIDKQYNFLIDGFFQLGTYTQGISDKDKGIFQNYAIMGGPELFFNSAVGLEFLIGYQYQKRTIKDQMAGFTEIRKGLSVSIGIQVHLINK